jgi:hypothetical protein
MSEFSTLNKMKNVLVYNQNLCSVFSCDVVRVA